MSLLHILAYFGAISIVLDVLVVGFLAWWSWQASKEDDRWVEDYLARERAKAEKRPYAG